MSTDLKAWQRSAIRNNMASYRRAQENYCIRGKPLVDLGCGCTAFSLVSPPLGSPVTRRRIRLIQDNLRQTTAQGDGDPGLPIAGRTPHVATIAVTYTCQCMCAHCSAALYQEEVARNQSALTYEEMKDAIRQTVDLGTTCVVLTGGEPLLHRRIYDLIECVDKTRSVCSLFTNGEMLIEENVEQLKKAGLFGVFLSLDHSDPAVHDAHRQRPGLARKGLRGLEFCRQAGILTGISTYATKENIRNGELEAMMDLAKANQVLEVFLFDVIPTGRLSRQHDCMLSDEEAEMIREFRARYNAKEDYPRIIHQTMFSSIAYPCVAEGCPAGMVQLHLRANGDVSPCDFTPYSFGNVRQKPLREIWEAMIHHDLYADTSRRCRLSLPGFWTRLEDLKAAQA